MATISFDRDIVIKSEKAVDKIINGLMKSKSDKINIAKGNIDDDLKRGEKLLKKLSLNLKK